MKHLGKMLAVAALAMVSYSANAELAPQWKEGTMIGNASLGIIPAGGSASLDYVLIDKWWKGHFTIGGEFDFRAENYSAVGIGPRATYGINITPNFEVHATLGFGFGIWNDSDNEHNNGSFIMWNEFIGCRYFFNDSFGIMAETGYSHKFPGLRAGISFKF